jgi:hypothetical protein
MRTRNLLKSEAAERGSALLVAIMVSVILALLGLSFLALADQENAISVNQRDADQLVFVGEAGARMVKAWFDRPVEGTIASPLYRYLGTYDTRLALWFDRDQRIFDHDNDPNTADVAAAGDPNLLPGIGRL